MFEISRRIATQLRRVVLRQSFDRFLIFGTERGAYFLRARMAELREPAAVHASRGETPPGRAHLVEHRFAA